MSQAFEPKRYKGKTAGVLGVGKSGQAVARLLAKKGFKLFLSDARPRREVEAALKSARLKAEWEGGGHGPRLLKCGFVVKSPGLPPQLPIFEKLRANGIPVFSELEVALAFSKADEIVAVTGTNGKTTTTALVGAIFMAARGANRVKVCGNIGTPISELAARTGPRDTLILEASSYQLEDSQHFHPHAAAILNITADHIDHHGSMRKYIEAKARIFREQGPQDACVFNAQDPLGLKLARHCAARKLFFGPRGHSPVHAWFEKGAIRLRLPGATKELAIKPPALPGEHNLENAMAAALLALSRGVKAAAIRKAFRSFKGIEHRLEEAGIVKGIRCINDSKATNVDSTFVALKALKDNGKKILLILGGLHKGLPYTPLKPLIESTVKGILTIGSCAGKIEEDLGGTVPILPCVELAVAVETALKIGSPGDILLLSPACASFDQFKNFEERGARFKELVQKAA